MTPKARRCRAPIRTPGHAPSDLEAGVELLQEAFAADPSNEAAFTFLREIWGTKEGNWERVVELLDRATQARPTNGSETFILAQAATLTWRQLGNMMRARGYFERLSAISPDHPSLKAFEKQIGEAINRALWAVNHPCRKTGRVPPRQRLPNWCAPAASDQCIDSKAGSGGNAVARGGQGGRVARRRGEDRELRAAAEARAPNGTMSTFAR